MCGIAGVYGGEHPGGDVVDRMLTVMWHRGPDEGGTWVEPGIALGNRRLSIIDPASGHQPVSNEDGTVVVVFNGEIYNYRELARDLRRRGHVLRTASDTEVIVHLYEERGEDLVHALRGMFTFAVWDRKRRRLFLARDRLGIKPLYYVCAGPQLAFASEIKALLQHDDVAVRLDHRALARYLTLKYVPAPGTLFEGVLALPPGHCLTCDDAGIRTRRWWKLSFEPGASGVTDDVLAAEQLRELLKDAVRAHLVSDVPFGAFLSGGLDSSTVVALMSQLLDGPVRTFSVGYDGEAAGISEFPYARMVADRYATEHHEVVVGCADFVALMEKVSWHLDQPIADEACLPTYVLSDYASRHVKMVLTGEGGDELFAGYARHAGERFAPLARAVPPSLRALALSASRRIPGHRRAKLALNALAEDDEARRLVHWFCLFDERRVRALLTDGMLEGVDAGEAVDTFRAHLADSDASDQLNRMLDLDTTLWLPDDLLARGDKMSMAASIEARLPLLDHHLVEFAATLPPRMKLRGRTRKYLLRQAVAPWLPAPVLHRRKQGFPTPVSTWFRGGARSFLRDHLSSSTLRRRGLFNPLFVERLLDDHERGLADNGSLLYGLLGVELWQRQFVDSCGRRPARDAAPRLVVRR